MKAIVHRHLQNKLTNRSNVVDAINNKIRPKVESRQDQYRILNVDNFEGEISRVFANSIRRQRQQPDAVRIPLFVYIPEIMATRNPVNSAGNNSRRRRATQARVAQARDEITRHLQQHPVGNDSNVRFGPIALNIWSRSRARQVVQNNIEELPTNNPAFDQAMRLDYLREGQNADPTQMEWAGLPVRWNNSDPSTVQVHLPTLRKLLGLPVYPLFDRDIFNEQPPTFPNTVAQDMEELDHILEE